MNRGRLLVRNLLYHWRGNLAILLGVVLGTAVLTGALLVGDSLRGSLREQTLRQLGWVDDALVASRFFRQALATDLGSSGVSPVILLQGTVSALSQTENGKEKTAQRAGRVTIFGVDGRFWAGGQVGASYYPISDRDFWQSSKNEVVLNQTLANDLNAKAGDVLVIHVQKISAIPRETLLGRREAGDVMNSTRVTVRNVLGADTMGQFSLNPSPLPPRNAFLPLSFLQASLNQAGRVNGLLAKGAPETLRQTLAGHLTLDDWGLTLHDPATWTQEIFSQLDRQGSGRLKRATWRNRISQSLAEAADRDKDGVLTREEVLAYFRTRHGYISLQSRQFLLEPTVVRAAAEVAEHLHMAAAPTLVYLANTISDGAHEIPYSVVAALDPSEPPPLGPFVPPAAASMHDNEILLAAWPESPLQAKPGDEITLSYFPPEENGRFVESKAVFRLKGVVPLAGVANDPNLTPAFPGITDKLDIRQWDPPFPYDNKRVQKRDENYWEEYRTVPKAYVTLAAGQRLWGSRFGDVTSIRLAPPPGTELNRADTDFKQELLSRLRPEQGGFVFDAVRDRGLGASVGGGFDFGFLFLGFSFFLIAAALLLVGLLFRLNLDRRASEIGLLLATGYSLQRVRWLLLVEGILLAGIGALVGLACAVGYAWLLLELLRAIWPGALDRSLLRLHVMESSGLSFLIGYVAALVISTLTIWWAVRILGRASPRSLLAGETADEPEINKEARHWMSWLISGGAAVGGLALLACGPFVTDHEGQAMSFLGGGALLLTSGLAAARAWLRGVRHGSIRPQEVAALPRLGFRNAGRHPTRSLLTIGLLAFAVFLLIAVESFHRAPDRDFLDFHSGSGGFALLGESNLPIYQDLNTARGRDELNFPADAGPTLAGVIFFPFRLRAGDDASCLNLYKPLRPRLLGVPRALIDRGGFRFQDSEARTAATKVNPWKLLDEPVEGAIPVIADATTVEWMLHSTLGGTVNVTDQRGEPVALRIVGQLSESIFQSQLLMSEANFLRLYPRQDGYQFFLIQAPPDHALEVKRLLGGALTESGFEATFTADRLAAYLAVENTYLATFQALGGLGLLLGAFGLAVVLLRTVWERRGELALLRALGFRRGALGWLVFSENSLLLALGLAVGTLAALAAVAPNLWAKTGEVPWQRLLAMIALVLTVGLGAAGLAVAFSLRAPIVQALRRE